MLKCGFPRELCRNWENSRGWGSHSWNTLESGQWGLAECCPVALGEVAQLGEAEAAATSAAVIMLRPASRSARLTSFNRRNSTYWVGLAPRNSAHRKREVRSLTATSAHNSGISRGRLRCSAKG